MCAALRRQLPAVLLLFAVGASACSRPAGEPASRSSATASRSEPGSGPLAAGIDDAPSTPSAADAGSGSSPAGRRRAVAAAPANVPGPAAVPGPRQPAVGVTSDSITVAYYWKGDRTRTSPYLRGTGVESNVDEAEAFRVWIDYINARKGRGELMGFPFDLHGRTLKGVVVEAGSTPEDAAGAAQALVSEIRPFAALAAHGSLSAYVCPRLAAAGMFNLATYDLDSNLAGRTNGWCLPSGATWDAQTDAVERYLTGRLAREPHAGPTGAAPRRFGVLWTEYPGLVASAPRLVERLRKAGLDVAETATVVDSLTQAQQQAPSAVAKFRAAGVNTVIIPDAGAPISFTPAAEAQGYRPDYVVWPCSGQDAPAMVRLYSSNQWARATGLTCYDQDFMQDLTHDGPPKQTEWYGRYMSVGRGEPPAQAPFIYAGLLPFLVGVTGAGRDLDAVSFRKALASFHAYRYDARRGRASDDRHMLLDLAQPDRPVIGDFTILRWSPTYQRGGGALAGAYVFPEDGKRYTRRATFNQSEAGAA